MGNKEKAFKDYKSFNQFLDNLVDESLGVFHEGFKDGRKRVKELLPNFDATLLVLSIGILEVDKATAIQDTTEEATKVQVISSPIDNSPSTFSEAIIVAEIPKVSMDIQLEALASQAVEG